MNYLANVRQYQAQQSTRRAFLGRTTQGLGTLALSSLMTAGSHTPVGAAPMRGVLDRLPHRQKAKRVIWL
jgi:hypothetical protein